MKPFAAKFRGHCDECGEVIAPGDASVYVARVLVHADCAPEVDRARPARICLRCRMTLPCECDAP
jgi:hypothetical protein